MQHWMKTQLANGFPALAGSSISGTLAVKQELVNEVLSELLHNTAAGSTGASEAVDLSVAAKLVKQAVVRAETGTLLVDFKIVI